MTTTTTPVTPDQIQFYQENGHLQVQHFLTREEAERIKRIMVEAIEKYDRIQAERQQRGDAEPEVAKVLRDSAYRQVLNQKVNLWQIDEAMREVVFDKRFAEAARLLTGAAAIRLFHDHALLKMPGDSKETPWHQDTPFWPMVENGALSIWIALDDVDENNGCMSFIPRSRNLGRLDPVSFLNPRDIIKEHIKGRRLDEVKVMSMEAGGVTFHDGLTFHYAAANKTDRPRHALAIIYMPDGITYSGKPHPITDGEGLVVGQPITGKSYPILASA